jgi:pimeloyl-ACP methyl ester carboxylesterase
MLPYTEHGAGDTVLLFLHFFGSSQREWRHVTPLLDTHFRCVTADMPGFGEAVGVTGYSVTERAAHLRTLVEFFAPAPVVLVAHSFSGKVSMVLAATPPANLKRLILVAPSPLVPEPMTDDERKQMRIRNQTREGAEAFIKGSHHRPLSEEDLELAIQDVLRADEDAWLAWPDSGSLEDWSTRITELKVHTDLIVGEYDKAIPLNFQREHTLPLVERNGGTLHVIKNAAHMLPNEAPQELASLIENTLRGIH